MVGDENVQYLRGCSASQIASIANWGPLSVMAVAWLLSSCQIPLALLPFTVYSIFHVATYTRTNLIPTFQPVQPSTASPGAKPKSTPLAETIGRFVKEYYDASMTLVASLEILLWFRVLFSAVIFTKGSWILLIFYTIFFRARYQQSAFVQNAIHQGSQRIDALTADQGLPPQVRQLWETIKALTRQAADLTDINRYVQGPAAAPKRTQ